MCVICLLYNSLIIPSFLICKKKTTTPRNEPGAFNPFEICLRQIGHPKEKHHHPYHPLGFNSVILSFSISRITGGRGNSNKNCHLAVGMGVLKSTQASFYHQPQLLPPDVPMAKSVKVRYPKVDIEFPVCK